MKDAKNARDWKMEDELGFEIIKAARLIEKQLSENLYQNFNLTLAQGKIILKLNEANNSNQKNLSDALYVEPATIVRTLDRMERDGFVKRKKHPTDRRVHLIHLTDKAKTIAPDLEKSVLNVFSKIIDKMDEDDKRNIKNGIDGMLKSFEN